MRSIFQIPPTADSQTRAAFESLYKIVSDLQTKASSGGSSGGALNGGGSGGSSAPSIPTNLAPYELKNPIIIRNVVHNSVELLDGERMIGFGTLEILDKATVSTEDGSFVIVQETFPDWAE